MIEAIAVLALIIAGYTTADPVREDWIGLALPDGRYSIVLLEGCEGIVPGMNVLFTSTELADYVGDCEVYVHARMDESPCEFNLEGLCDVAAE